MSIRRNPLYVFKDINSIGIFDVPLDSVIQVVDSDGTGTPSMTMIIGKVGMNAGTTIGQYLTLVNNYEELDRYVEELNDLLDVNVNLISNGDLFMYDLNSRSWVNRTLKTVAGAINLSDLKDTPMTSSPGNDGDTLIYQGGRWNTVVAVKDLNDLGDVTTAPIAGEVLVFDGTRWVSSNIDGGSF